MFSFEAGQPEAKMTCLFFRVLRVHAPIASVSGACLSRLPRLAASTVSLARLACLPSIPRFSRLPALPTLPRLPLAFLPCLCPYPCCHPWHCP